MVRRIVVAVVPVGIIVALSLSPPVRDEISWRLSGRGARLEDCVRYLRNSPSGRHAAEARQKVDARTWQDAVSKHTSESYGAYLALCPQGAHADEAKTALGELRWLEPRLSKLPAHSLLSVGRAYQRLSEASARLESLVGRPATGGIVGAHAWVGGPYSGKLNKYLVTADLLNGMGDYAPPKIAQEHADLETELSRNGVLAALQRCIAASEALEKAKAEAERLSGLSMDHPEAISQYCRSRKML